MSQIYKSLAAGPVPPAVPEQFTADDATVAVPVANNLNLFSRDTTDDNANGIQTTADPNGSDNFYVEMTNRITGTAITSDGAGQTQILTSFVLGAIPATYLLEIRIIAYNVTDALSAGYTSTSTIRTTGAAGSEIDASPGIISEEGAMSGVVVSNFIVGNTVETQVVGIAGKVINWRALTNYIMVT